jgi:hypothetical protein
MPALTSKLRPLIPSTMSGTILKGTITAFYVQRLPALFRFSEPASLQVL